MRLRDALRQARIEAADRTGVVVDLRDAEVARLEILNEALDPLFAQIPGTVDLFDRGISQGETPRLWIDVVAHVLMGRDKRIYRFVQDTRFGRIVIAESHDVAVIVDAITDYVARRMIERVRNLWEQRQLTLIFIEHDMDIVFQVANTIRVLCYGRVLAEGTPDEIRNNKAVIEAYLGTEADAT